MDTSEVQKYTAKYAILNYKPRSSKWTEGLPLKFSYLL
jgi:hypothetical protein